MAISIRAKSTSAPNSKSLGASVTAPGSAAGTVTPSSASAAIKSGSASALLEQYESAKSAMNAAAAKGDESAVNVAEALRLGAAYRLADAKEKGTYTESELAKLEASYRSAEKCYDAAVAYDKAAVSGTGTEEFLELQRRYTTEAKESAALRKEAENSYESRGGDNAAAKKPADGSQDTASGTDVQSRKEAVELNIATTSAALQNAAIAIEHGTKPDPDTTATPVVVDKATRSVLPEEQCSKYDYTKTKAAGDVSAAVMSHIEATNPAGLGENTPLDYTWCSYPAGAVAWCDDTATLLAAKRAEFMHGLTREDFYNQAAKEADIIARGYLQTQDLKDGWKNLLVPIIAGRETGTI